MLILNSMGSKNQFILNNNQNYPSKEFFYPVKVNSVFRLQTWRVNHFHHPFNSVLDILEDLKN